MSYYSVVVNDNDTQMNIVGYGNSYCEAVLNAVEEWDGFGGDYDGEEE